MSTNHHITLDMDWCSDDALEYVSSLLLQAGKKATWFATHRSPRVDMLCREPGFEIGVHPNFFDGSSHGASISSVLEHMTGLFPEARAMRTHGLYQSTPILHQAVSDFAIEIDVSLFLPYHSELKPLAPMSFGKEAIKRLPYFWEDDTEMLNDYSGFDFTDKRHHCDGLKIYDFHPVHVALNTTSFDDYLRLKDKKPASEWDTAFILKHQKKGKGPLTFFEDMLSKVEGELTISQIAEGE